MMILLTGGSGCGKSSFAEGLCMKLPGPLYYVAAMQPFGEGGLEKIRRHREMRAGKGFETFERYTDVDTLTLPGGGTVLLECICNLTANEMFDSEGNETSPVDKVLGGVRNLRSQCENLIVITNDVGGDAMEYSESTVSYRNCMGYLNAVLASEADTVAEMVCGIPLVLKGALPV